MRQSPLHDQHVSEGAKLTEFGGWEMPLAYPEGTLAEHRACRTSAVMFDVSHLGTVRVAGSDAFERLQQTLSNDLGRITPGRAQYTHLLNADGGVEDDIIVWWLDDTTFDVMPNASNTTRVVEALRGPDVTAERAVLAIQGPKALTMVAQVIPELAGLGRFQVRPFNWNGVAAWAAGTGYTGESGVELAIPSQQAGRVWVALREAGLPPAGLGARDTLRLEAGLPLHGHELGPGITPLEAGLGWVVGWDKETFIGREALVRERSAGSRRRLAGFAVDGRQPPREGAEILHRATPVGMVTSGNFSPMLEHGIAMGFVEVEPGGEGTSDGSGGDGDWALGQRGRILSARPAARPFVTPGQFAGRSF